MNKYVIGVWIISLMLCSCSTVTKSTLAGSAVGGVLGATMGNNNGRGDDRDKNTLNGLAIGAIIGGLIGYASHKDKPQNDIQNFSGIIIDVPGGMKEKLPPPPRITKPVVTIKKVERQKVGSSTVRSEGYEWVIKRGCEWVVE